MIKNYGFTAPEIKPEEYIFGGGQLAGVVLREDGQWDDFLPIYEPQAENYETSGCTVWGGQNQIETLHKFLFKIEPNYSERFNYILAEVSLSGQSPQITYESFRKQGLIDHSLLPVPDTYEEFITPRPMSEPLLLEGEKWLGNYELGHDWILTGTEPKESRVKKIKEALKYCPVAVSVTAWYEENGVYVDRGQPNSHWCLAYGYDNKYFKIFDSYDHSKKLIPFDHTISFAKRITLAKKAKKNWFDDLISRLWLFIKEILWS